MAPDDDQDVDGGLQPVARRTSPPLWIGGWALGLGVVVAIGLIGTLASSPSHGQLLGDVVIVVPSPSPATTSEPTSTPSPTPLPVAIPRIIRPFATLPPVPTRPPLGEDGLVGGLVFGTNWPPEP
jgi:hypothetical protein